MWKIQARETYFLSTFRSAFSPGQDARHPKRQADSWYLDTGSAASLQALECHCFRKYADENHQRCVCVCVCVFGCVLSCVMKRIFAGNGCIHCCDKQKIWWSQCRHYNSITCFFFKRHQVQPMSDLPLYPTRGPGGRRLLGNNAWQEYLHVVFTCFHFVDVSRNFGQSHIWRGEVLFQNLLLVCFLFRCTQMKPPNLRNSHTVDVYDRRPNVRWRRLGLVVIIIPFVVPGLWLRAELEVCRSSLSHFSSALALTGRNTPGA